MASCAVAYSSSLAFSPIDSSFCSSILTRAWHRLRLLQRESGVACSVLWFVRQRLLSRNDHQQRKRVKLEEKLSILIEHAQHSTRNLVFFLSRKQRPIPRGGGVLNKCLPGEAPVPKSNPLPTYIPYSTKTVSLSYIFY